MTCKVAIVRCPDYNYSNVNTAVKRCIDLLPKDAIPKNKRILLKPNLLSSRKGPDVPVNTHPVIVEVLARILKEEYSAIVYIGDSCGGMSYGQTQSALMVSGMCDISKRLGIQLVNFENNGIINLKNENNKIRKEFPITKFIRDVDFIISLPKLKTHSLVGYTGAVKNMMGLVPGSGKRDMHLSAPKPWQMEHCIVDLYGLVKPHFAVMDAIVSMEGDGPAAGIPKGTRLILASTDAVALDTIALEITGYNSKEMIFIKDAKNRRLGVGDIDEIEIVGESIEDVYIRDFKKPIGGIKDYVINFIPGPILKKMYAGMTSGEPIISQILCKRCNMCYDNCPVKAIEYFSDGNLKINSARCIECYCCHEFCPYNAIVIKVPIFVRVIRVMLNLARKIIGRR